MAISLDDDLDACFSTDDFAVVGSFSSGGGNVNGYFTNASESVSIGEDDLARTMIEATDATFQCPTSDIPNVRQGHTVTIGSTVYKIKRIQRSGMGVSVCWLKT